MSRASSWQDTYLNPDGSVRGATRRLGAYALTCAVNVHGDAWHWSVWEVRADWPQRKVCLGSSPTLADAKLDTMRAVRLDRREQRRAANKL